MIQRLIYEGEKASQLLTRACEAQRDVSAAVEEIFAQVSARGDEAVLDFCQRFDGVRPQSLLVTQEEIDRAYERTTPELLDTMRLAAKNIERFHAQQKRSGFIDASESGVVVGQRVLPLQSVGLYVPGGTARYPSSVLMNAIPAKIAGVENIIMTTPPDKDGRVPDVILAAAKLAGVSRIVRLGGAQAVAALAFGTQSIPRVDKIVGPGNIYVATAKQRAYALGLCDIDMVAGPSEIMVIADEHNDPEIVAADLLSQAEHDKLASSWLVTTSAALADAVTTALEKQIPCLSRADIARASIDSNGRIMLVQRLSDAVKIANEIAPEHLEVAVDDPFALLPLLRNAGSIFLGRHTPEPLGDYLAGPNHTLPTSGTARYSSPLGVDDFCKRSSYLYYSAEALQKVESDVIRFATSEGLTAHAEAVAFRMRKGAREQ